jgi:hypothetical protein
MIDTLRRDEHVSYRGGTVIYDISSVFTYLENGRMGTYQNYLGGGMLGAIQCGYDFNPDDIHEEDREQFESLRDAMKRYHHALTNHEGDEYEAASYEDNQRRPASAY